MIFKESRSNTTRNYMRKSNVFDKQMPLEQAKYKTAAANNSVTLFSFISPVDTIKTYERGFELVTEGKASIMSRNRLVCSTNEFVLISFQRTHKKLFIKSKFGLCSKFEATKQNSYYSNKVKSVSRQAQTCIHMASGWLPSRVNHLLCEAMPKDKESVLCESNSTKKFQSVLTLSPNQRSVKNHLREVTTTKTCHDVVTLKSVVHQQRK